MNFTHGHTPARCPLAHRRERYGARCFVPQSSAKTSAFGQRPEQTGAKFVIALELKGGHNHRLEEEIHALGSAFRISAQLWLVTGPQTVNSIRNQLSQFLDRSIGC